MKGLRFTLTLTLVVFTGSTWAIVPTATTSQTGFCSGVVAETKATGRGDYLVGTSLYVESGPVGGKQWYDFYDEENMGYSGYRPNAQSIAGCEDCMPEYSTYSKTGISEHFWQEAEVQYFTGYCPHSSTFGIWLPGEYCELVTRTHPGCISG